MQHQPKYYKSIVFFVILFMALGIAMPVLADYLGPNRTVTTTVSVCKVYLYKCTEVEPGKWKDVKDEDWLCSNESKPWEPYDSGGACHPGNDGHKHWEKKDTVQTTTITHPPATITGSIQNCTLYNGWCGITAPELALSAAEPLAGYNITLIEGTFNGTSFACQPGETNCNLPMVQGDNIFNYWALSSWGDSSLMGTTTVKVDTVPPEVTLSVTGTAGNHGWYKSPIQVAANAVDATSGVATFEVAVDGGGYQTYTNMTLIPLTSDGVHTLQLRVVDNAGNVFEPPAQNFYIDTIPPTVNLPGSWQLGRNVPYNVVDEGSGLGALRIVIEDEDEKYAKVAWDEDRVSGRSYSQDIDWNGQFKDKTIAPPGTYLVWIKACDVAGNEHFELGKVIVPEPNYVGAVVLPTGEPAVAIQPSSPPAELSQPGETSSLPASPEGTKMTTTTHSFTLTSGAAGGTTSSSAATTSSGVLWGAAAAAAISAATAYALEATRKRKEAEEAQAAAVRAEVAKDKAKRAEKGLTKEEKRAEKAKQAAAHDQKVQERKERQSWENPAKEKARLKQQEEAYQQWLQQQQKLANVVSPDGIPTYAQSVYVHGKPPLRAEDVLSPDKLQFIGQQERNKEEKKKAGAAAAKQAEQLAKLQGYSSEKQAASSGTIAQHGDVKESATPEKEKPWWQKTWDGIKNTADKAIQWVDQHQTEIAIIVGVVAGVAAVILTAGTATPFLVAAGAAMLAGGMTVAAGTVGLNAYYDRPLTQNLLKNVVIAAGTTFVTAAAGTLLTKGIFALGNSVAGYCAMNPPICARAEVVMNAIDTVEEVGLTIKGAFQTWRGDSTGAAETALEIQMEHMDGGMPGNSVAKGLGEEAIEKIANYGDEAVSLVRLYGNDAAQIILKYGDEGIGLLNKHGLLAIKIMDAVDLKHAKELLEVLDDDVLSYVVMQSPEAVDALSRWSADDLAKYGPELALRAQKDADVLAAVKKLIDSGPIDPKHLTKEQQELIDTIAANSTQYIENGQVVLGKWVDQGSGFVKVAQDTGSLHYNPHPDMWKMLGGLGKESQEEAAWLINRQVVQNGIDKGLPFEYTFNGIPDDVIGNEDAAIQAIFSGKTDAEIMKVLKSEYMPIRMKELQELQKAGYELIFDEANNSYILIQP